MELKYRQATIKDLDDVMKIYTDAQKYMESYGNPQWEKGFPDRSDIEGGIYGGIIYVVTDRDETVAVFSVVNHDEDYDTIDGRWLTDGNYLAVHRVAVREESRRKGVGQYILSRAAAGIASERGRNSLRFDTHEKNTPMISLIEKCGAVRCGTIEISRNGSTRIAFEKILQGT